MLTLTTALLLAGPAMADELSWELGTSHAPDATWSLFSDGSTVTTQGIRYGHSLDLDDRLSVVAGWHHGVAGAMIYMEDGSDQDTWGSDFHTSFTSEIFTLGPKYGYTIKGWLTPYATAQLMGWWGRMRIDEDIDHEGNPNEFKFSSLVPGGYAAAGVDVAPIKIKKGKLRVGSYLELGYSHTLTMHFSDPNGSQKDTGEAMVADLGFHGLAVRWGVGLRF